MKVVITAINRHTWQIADNETGEVLAFAEAVYLTDAIFDHHETRYAKLIGTPRAIWGATLQTESPKIVRQLGVGGIFDTRCRNRVVLDCKQKEFVDRANELFVRRADHVVAYGNVILYR